MISPGCLDLVDLSDRSLPLQEVAKPHGKRAHAASTTPAKTRNLHKSVQIQATTVMTNVHHCKSIHPTHCSQNKMLNLIFLPTPKSIKQGLLVKDPLTGHATHTGSFMLYSAAPPKVINTQVLLLKS